MAMSLASPVRKPAFAPEPMSPRKPAGRSKDDEFAEFQTPVLKPFTQEQCLSDCPTTCPSGFASFDLASPSPSGIANMGRDNGEEPPAELESLQDLPKMANGMANGMGFQDFQAFFLPPSSASSTPWQVPGPWQIPGGAPQALPDSRPSTPPVGVSAPGPLNTPPPPPNQRAAAKPDLLRALTSHNLQAVQEALADDPGAVNEPFWEQKCEPPICCAVRVGCPPAIVAELLGRGADVHAMDVHDCTPYMLLQEVKARQQTMAGPRVAQHEWDVVGGLLLEAGAQTTESNTYVQEDTWGAALLPFDAPLGAFLPPPLPWNNNVLPPMAQQY